MAYIATIEGVEKEYKVEVFPVEEDLYKVVIDGEKELVLDIRRHGCCVYSVLIDGKSYEIDVDEKSNGDYSVLVGDEHFRISIMDEMKKKLLQIMGEGVGAATGEVTTAMPGMVVKVLVKEGDRVKKDQPLVILEAMKMENVVASPRGGVIKEVHVSQGTAVEKSQLLIEFEND